MVTLKMNSRVLTLKVGEKFKVLVAPKGGDDDDHETYGVSGDRIKRDL